MAFWILNYTYYVSAAHISLLRNCHIHFGGQTTSFPFVHMTDYNLIRLTVKEYDEHQRE